jgi:hypothetical protein
LKRRPELYFILSGNTIIHGISITSSKNFEKRCVLTGGLPGLFSFARRPLHHGWPRAEALCSRATEGVPRVERKKPGEGKTVKMVFSGTRK